MQQSNGDVIHAHKTMTSARNGMLALILALAFSSSVAVGETAGDVVVCRADDSTRCRYNATLALLDCSNSRCTEYQFNATSAPSPVSWIDLSGNSLTTVKSVTAFCSELVEIDLSSNRIADIEKGAFEGCARLESIDLAANSLLLAVFLKTPVDEPLFGLPKLKALNLASNRLGNLTNQPFHDELSTLERLNVSNNGIRAIDRTSMTDFIKLVVLDLSRNEIASVDASHFRGMPNLVELDLSHNRIAKIDDDALVGLDSLAVLRLTDNRLAALPTQMPPNVKALYLDDNDQLLAVGQTTDFGEELTTISIRNCDNLGSVGSKAFSGLRRLTTVDISGNARLTKIDRDAFDGNVSAATHVNLSYNALDHVDANLLNWNVVRTLDLSGNSWDCDCDMVWMRHMHLAGNGSLFGTVVCSTPLHMYGMRLSDVVDEKLSCSYVQRYRLQGAVGLIVVVTVLFATVIVTVGVRQRRTLMPCWFDPGSKYETLYSATEAAFETDDAVQIVKASPEIYRAAVRAGEFKAEPTAV